MDKLRVLHVIGGGEFGGAEQHILNLLASLPADEVEAAVVCFYDSLFASELRKAGVPVIALDRFGRFDLRLLQALREAFRSFQPHLIHTHGVKANFFSRLAARGSGATLLTTVHSSLRYDYTHPLAYALVSLMERGTRRWNRHYIAISGAIAEILQKDGVAQDNISIIYNGTDLSPYRQTDRKDSDRIRLREEWGIPQDVFLFGTVARFVPVKGLPLLVDAFAALVRECADATPHLVMVGDGPERPILEAKVREHGLEGRVAFGGFRQDIPACLHACDAFVHSSYYEGLGYTIIEAMASEVPVVASHVGGVREFVTDHQTGLAVEPGDTAGLTRAMMELLQEPELRARLAQNALALVEGSFTIQQMAAQTLALYRELLE
ncbi:glycosyltransferase [Brevibacillus composti]|uniref:Glycosyltransferase n=1 Tax=Brevibacillus composti TaxID=2796470 RepID=A0A7T5EIS7_9BACL|nr:glycosyltransferase [Brevibacillus composti]QQE73416.1 glycosyltransferase [Brevibacillus composti]QUO40497.1 glycosyltransferase [Brevibacillus composti]